ncbi:FAD-dependent oxidoreductase [Candidatus Micrarchaeota archaeon]|nr:FAD-dependent oxidoreductase [Candidatus Micrarchaeota archaeon]
MTVKKQRIAQQPKGAYDVIVIGGGPAGLSAALYATRFGLKTLVLTREKGGLIVLTHIVENYPGIGVVSGIEMMDAFEKHVKQFGAELREENVEDVEKHGDCYAVRTGKGTYLSPTLIFATGTERRKLGVLGEKEFTNKGVSYCAVCDGPLFRGKVVGVVGGSDSAVKEALLLAEYASKVYIFYRGEGVHPEPINMKRLEALIGKGKVEVIPNTNVLRIEGTKFVDRVVLDRAYKGKREFPLGGLFIEIGGIPQTQLAAKLGVKLNEEKEIIIDRVSKTNADGIFACGDACDGQFKQAITGAAEGVLAAFSAYNYLGGKKVVCM